MPLGSLQQLGRAVLAACEMSCTLVCQSQAPCQRRAGQAPGRLRVFWYYLPVFFWCRHQLAEHQAAAAERAGERRPLVVGMQAPQVGLCPAPGGCEPWREVAPLCLRRRPVEGSGAAFCCDTYLPSASLVQPRYRSAANV